jgi:hypothetical protein
MRQVSTGLFGWFGLRPPAGVEFQAAWGARAIQDGRGKKQIIATLPDRKQAYPEDPDLVPEAFKAWLNGKLGSWLNRNCDAGWIDPGSPETFRLDDGVFHAVASPNRSHGYLYVGAWMDADAAGGAP